MVSVKQQLRDALSEQVLAVTGEVLTPTVSIPADLSHGDYTTNVAMITFAKQKEKGFSSPLALAGALVEALEADNRFTFVERLEVIKPGFINVFLKQDFLITEVAGVLEREKTAVIGKSYEGKKIIVEYTDPNPFKEFHIGHLFSNIIGESLARLFQAEGGIVRRADYFGDVGMHVAKCLYGILNAKLKMQNAKLNKDEFEIYMRDLESKPLEERVKVLGKAYALGAAAYEDETEAKEEIVVINRMVYLAAQRMWQEEKNITPQIDYHQGNTIDTDYFDRVYLVYTKGRSWSLDYFETIYKRLGTAFDAYYPESLAGEKGYQLVKAHIDDGVFQKSEGAIVFVGEAVGLHTRVFINTLGLPTYEAKELGLAPWKYEEFAYDLSFIVTANEIDAYFKVILAAMERLNPSLAHKTRHIGHGFVRLPEGKMSSRTGNIITGEWLLDEAKRRIQARFSDMTDELADIVAVGAIKYAFLKSGIGRDIAFSFEESISLEGNSGPYIQYTFARTQSVLAKAGDREVGLARPRLARLEMEEEQLVRMLYQYSDVVDQAAEDFSPNLIASYLFTLAHTFNLFYQKHKIIGHEQESFRLGLTKAVGKTLAHGLSLLGIEAPERM